MNEPVLPLRDIVVFPQMIVPLFVGRNKSVKALEIAMSDNKDIVLVTQKVAKVEDPKPKDLYSIGTICKILQLLKLPDGTLKVLVEGKKRVKIDFLSESEDINYLTCNFKILWGDDAVGVQDEESWFDAIQISERLKQSGAWFSVVHDDGTETKFQRKQWLDKLQDEKFRKTVLTIMDEDVIMKFSNREGNAADFYDLEESPPEE